MLTYGGLNAEKVGKLYGSTDCTILVREYLEKNDGRTTDKVAAAPPVAPDPRDFLVPMCPFCEEALKPS